MRLESAIGPWLFQTVGVFSSQCEGTLGTVCHSLKEPNCGSVAQSTRVKNYSVQQWYLKGSSQVKRRDHPIKRTQVSVLDW